jgi:anti-sigma B factor antagonist
VRDPFVLTTTREADVSVLHLGGFVDAHTARDFERGIQAEVDAGHYRLVVDCAGLTYISSAGLGVFMGFVEETREHGGDIKVCGLIPKVRQVFDLLGFGSVFDVVDDVPAAVRRFAAPPRKEA